MLRIHLLILCRLLGGLLCLPAVPLAAQQPDSLVIPLDPETQLFRYERVQQQDNHHRMEFFFRAAKFVGKNKALKDILVFDRVVTDSTLIYARGFLLPTLDEVKVRVTYRVRMEFGFDYYRLQVYDFRMDGHHFEDIYFYKGRFTHFFRQVMGKVFVLTDNHVNGVLNTLDEILRKL
ncbi:MAG: hypothetical protein KF690_04410 [Bacteroidetes bacterium]|nr:hypothetical protein [Bacteroidota bacterium]